MRTFATKEITVKTKTTNRRSSVRTGTQAADRCDSLARWKASVETLVAVKAAINGTSPAIGAKVLRLAELRGLIALLKPVSPGTGTLPASPAVDQLRRVYRLEIRRLQAEIAATVDFSEQT